MQRCSYTQPVPELPEVEVTRRRLAPLLVGRVIESVETTKDSYFFLTKPALLKQRLPGRSVLALKRLGKYLLAELDDGDRLLLHLGMTGQLFSSAVSSVRLFSAKTRGSLPPEALREFKPDAHTHLSLHFEDGGPSVLFRDVRKFGKVQLIRAGAGRSALGQVGGRRTFSQRRNPVHGRARPQDPDQEPLARSERESPASATTTRTKRYSWPKCGPRAARGGSTPANARRSWRPPSGSWSARSRPAARVSATT